MKNWLKYPMAFIAFFAVVIILNFFTVIGTGARPGSLIHAIQQGIAYGAGLYVFHEIIPNHKWTITLIWAVVLITLLVLSLVANIANSKYGIYYTVMPICTLAGLIFGLFIIKDENKKNAQ